MVVGDGVGDGVGAVVVGDGVVFGVGAVVVGVVGDTVGLQVTPQHVCLQIFL